MYVCCVRQGYVLGRIYEYKFWKLWTGTRKSGVVSKRKFALILNEKKNHFGSLNAAQEAHYQQAREATAKADNNCKRVKRCLCSQFTIA